MIENQQSQNEQERTASQPTVAGNVSWRPFKVQVEALTTTAREILYGGSRGGGKTACGMAWLLYDITNPRFRALVVRRNAIDLSDWIARAKQMYRPMRAVFTANPAQIVFPSGATIVLGHLGDSEAYQRYQGHEYHRILLEELTQIPNEILYVKLISSARSTVPGLTPQVFATTNPGGPGHLWVKKRWRIEGTPKESIYTVDQESMTDRIFIPARVDDNPHLMKLDPNYIRFLDGLPDGLREQWRLGSWSNLEIKGSFYGEFLTHARNQQRIQKGAPLHIPSLPVFTVWDIGVQDATAIGFFQRIVNDGNGLPLDTPRLNMIDYYESNAKGLEHYVKLLQTRPYIYGVHFAPHDIAVTEWGSGITRLETAKMLGIEFTPLKKKDIAEGINAVEAGFYRFHCNEQLCEQFLDNVRQYRREWDDKLLKFKDKALHDFTSHSADVLRYAFDAEEQMINPGDYNTWEQEEYQPLFGSINI